MITVNMGDVRNFDLQRSTAISCSHGHSSPALLAAVGLGTLASCLSGCTRTQQGVRNLTDRQGSRPMTQEQSHKLLQYAVKRCAGASNEGIAKVMCMQAAILDVMKRWNAGQTPSFLN
ncbi:hypothetical protein [Rhizobium leucaenae]|uniref:hypothetical protein n=1 Tax=Rhizobium leucaenae TaxID=29450 RepID=UPI0012EA505C|nr:hypothetical protein [Rhizobium leucaenae]MBB6303792.1 hypothetical protein [Rhizobium leucaenae]